MKQIEIENIVAPGIWIDLEAKVVELWEPNNEKISQVGLLEDKTGVVKFVNWTTSGIGQVEAGKRYTFKNVVTDAYNGKFSIKLTKKSKVIGE